MAIESAQLADQMIQQRGGREDPVWTWMATNDPGYMAAYNRTTQSAFGYYGDGSEDPHVVEPKTKELIAIAVLAAQRDWERFPNHLERLLDLGATDKEVLEALQTSAVISGGPAMRGGIWMLMQSRERRAEAEADAG